MKTGFFSLFTAAVLLQAATAQPHGIHHRHHRRQVGKDAQVVTDVEYVTVEASEVVVYVNEQGDPVSTTTVYFNQPSSTVASSSSSSSVYSPPSSSPAATTSSTPSLAPGSSTPAAPSSFSVFPTSPTTEAASTSTSAPAPASSTSTPAPAPPSSTSAPAPPSSSISAPAPPSSSTSAPAPPSSTPAPAPSSSSTPAPPPSSPAAPSSAAPQSTSASSSAPVSSGSSPPPAGGIVSNAISYSPYNADNSCKTSSQVAQDLAQIESYGVIRLYGTDCNQTANVVAATQGKNTKIFQGIYDITQIPSEVELISKAVNGDWSRINTVNVGNELVQGGTASSAVISAIGTARAALKGAGYTGPVVTVDTMVAMNSTIDLCTASDFCAINCHPFFDTHTAASGAGDFVQMWVKSISQQTGKTVVVTETGWPTGGDSHDLAVPSKENQDAAVASLKSAMPENMILFSAYNTPWKRDNSGTYGAEKFWGIQGTAPSD